MAHDRHDTGSGGRRVVIPMDPVSVVKLISYCCYPYAPEIGSCRLGISYPIVSQDVKSQILPIIKPEARNNVKSGLQHPRLILFYTKLEKRGLADG